MKPVSPWTEQQQDALLSLQMEVQGAVWEGVSVCDVLEVCQKAADVAWDDYAADMGLDIDDD